MKIWILGCLWFVFAAWMPAQQPGIVDNGKPTFTTFAVSGASGTFPISINAAGVIAGQYATAKAVNGSFTHGFVRAADGAITSFDAPGGTHTISTSTEAINAAGTIAGYYVYVTSTENEGFVPLFYGFVRAADGTFTTFSAPGAGTGEPYQGTFALGIDTAGTIAGYYLDANFVSHGFARTAGGTVTSFDPTGSVGTIGESINAAGTIAGYYSDAAGTAHGFVRTADGAIVSFDAPGADTGAGRGTRALSINAAGAIAGYYSDANGLNRGFVRAAGGAIATFAVTGPGTALGQGTSALSIDAEGVVVGYYIVAKKNAGGETAHGFVRSAGGAITTFEVPGAGTGSRNGTYPASIDNAGAIAGSYYDASGLGQGFLLTQ